MAVDINALVESYIEKHPDTTAEGALAALVATGQQKIDPKRHSYSAPSLDDYYINKNSVTALNNNLNGEAVTATGVNILGAGLASTIAVSKGGFNLLDKLTSVNKDNLNAIQGATGALKRAMYGLFMN
jgi:hypothetical protein